MRGIHDQSQAFFCTSLFSIVIASSLCLVPPYGDMELGQHWLRQWLVAWRHQAITWTNVDWSVRSHGIHLGASSLEDLKKTIKETRLKIAVLKWHPGLPGANELMPIVLLENSVWWRTQPTYFFSGEPGLDIMDSIFWRVHASVPRI